MKSLKSSVIILVALCLLGFSGLGVLAEEKDMKNKGKTDEEETYTKEEVYDTLSKEFSVDKETLAELEKKGLSLGDTAKIIILARYRTDELTGSRQVPITKDKETMQESIKYFLDKKEKDAGWGDLSLEVGLPTRHLLKMSGVILHGFHLDEGIIKDLEKKGLSLQDSIKIIILSENLANNLVDSGKYTKKEELDKATKESINYLLDKKQKGAGWGELTYEAEIAYRDLNKITNIILAQQEGEKKDK